MTVETLLVVEPGLLTTVQDRGRYGFQRVGVPTSGVMDEFPMRAANILVGNDEGAAGLEMTVLGPRIKVLRDTLVAMTGGDLSPEIDGEPVENWRSIRVSRDSVISFKGVRDGMRSYLAVAGGIDVPVVLGSRSTYLSGRIGGLEGRPLKAGDVLPAPLVGAERLIECGLPEDLEAPTYAHQDPIRLVLGPQDGAFTAEAIDILLGCTYSIALDSDRMGYRLEGPAIDHLSGPDIVSDGTPLGAVQVPGDRQPIILLADRGTTGGYAKIATVISADIGRLSQMMPRDELTFTQVTVQEGQAVLREQEDVLARIRAAVSGQMDGLSIVVEGQVFEVVDETGTVVAGPDAPEDGVQLKGRHARATVDGQTFEFDVETNRLG